MTVTTVLLTVSGGLVLSFGLSCFCGFDDIRQSDVLSLRNRIGQTTAPIPPKGSYDALAGENIVGVPSAHTSPYSCTQNIKYIKYDKTIRSFIQHSSITFKVSSNSGSFLFVLRSQILSLILSLDFLKTPKISEVATIKTNRQKGRNLNVY